MKLEVSPRAAAQRTNHEVTFEAIVKNPRIYTDYH